MIEYKQIIGRWLNKVHAPRQIEVHESTDKVALYRSIALTAYSFKEKDDE